MINSKADFIKQSVKCLGIYLAFPYAENASFHREGIIRHQFFVLRALLQNYPTLRLEIWSVDINAENFRLMFLEQLGDFQERLDFRNVPLFAHKPHNQNSDSQNSDSQNPELQQVRMSWKQRLISKIKRYPIGQYLRRYKKWLTSNPWFSKIINAYKYNYDNDYQRFIVKYINTYHNCDLMYFTYNWGLGARLNMPKVLVIHDLHTITHAELFAMEIGEEQLKKDNAMLLQNIQNFLANKTELIVLCDYVKNTQLCKFLPNIDVSKVHTIYTPITAPTKAQTMDKAELLQKYNLKPDLNYIFYPTQIRAQKNLAVVVRALDILRRKYGLTLYLVNTGEPRQYPPFAKLLSQLDFSHYFIRLSTLTDTDLYAFYRHAFCGVAPSYTEGNFPLQAMEALAMQTPVALAKVGVTLDRLQKLSVDLQELQQFFFEPDDAETLAEILHNIWKIGKTEAFAKQQILLNELQKYTWDEASAKYYQVLQQTLRHNLPNFESPNT